MGRLFWDVMGVQAVHLGESRGLTVASAVAAPQLASPRTTSSKGSASKIGGREILRLRSLATRGRWPRGNRLYSLKPAGTGQTRCRALSIRCRLSLSWRDLP